MKRFLSEAFGTFSLVFAGCGAVVVNDVYGSALGHVGVAAAFGLIVMIMIYSVGNISGAHLNPAVTLGFFTAKRITIKDIFLYLPAQFLGGLLATALLLLLFPGHPTYGMTLPAGSLLQSFVLEVVLTFILMSIILNVSSGHMEKGIMAGVAIGGFIAVAALIGGPVSGASMNPARSLAPAVISFNFQHLWIYFTAPFFGAILASPMCCLIQGNECKYCQLEDRIH